MKTKHLRSILGGVFIVLGVVLLLFSHYIVEQVSAGKVKLREGQQKVDAVDSLFSISPPTKSLGQMFTAGGQKQINEGWDEVAKYQNMAHNLQIGGVVLLIAGAALLIFWRKK